MAMAAALWRASAGGAARHSVGGAPDRSRRRPLAAARYNARHAVAILSEHEPVPSSRETTASAVSSLNRLVNRKKPYIDDVINGVVHALNLDHRSNLVAGYVAIY